MLEIVQTPCPEDRLMVHRYSDVPASGSVSEQLRLFLSDSRPMYPTLETWIEYPFPVLVNMAFRGSPVSAGMPSDKVSAPKEVVLAPALPESQESNTMISPPLLLVIRYSPLQSSGADSTTL